MSVEFSALNSYSYYSDMYHFVNTIVAWSNFYKYPVKTKYAYVLICSTPTNSSKGIISKFQATCPSHLVT